MNIILVIVSILSVIAMAGVLIFYRKYLVKKIVGDELLAIRRVQQDIHALCSGAINMGKHIDVLEHRLRRLAERQDQLELRDPVEQTYAHAIRLAQKGADVKQLIENCGLARGEAELLLRVHNTQDRQASTADFV